MIVCHCHAVNDRTIREAVREGASSYRKVALACNAGRVCGGCRPAVLQVIDEETGSHRASVACGDALAATG